MHLDIRNMTGLGQAIRAERKRQRMNQEQLAAKAGCNLRFISELERGKSRASSDLVLAVIDALGGKLSIEWRSSLLQDS